jgi:hypothetical protein
LIIRKLIILFALLLSQPVFAAKYYNFMYKIVDGDNFGSILKQFVKDESIINAKTPLVKKIIAKNPQVLNWAQLTPGILIEVYVSEDFIDMTKYKKYESANI